MKLSLCTSKPITPDTGLRWRSDGRLWEVRVDPEKEGFRVSVHHMDALDERLCGYFAEERQWVQGITSCVLAILSGFDEDAHPKIVAAIWPEQHSVPMERDSACWRRLRELAGFDDRADQN